jgi:hypothetical protein
LPKNGFWPFFADHLSSCLRLCENPVDTNWLFNVLYGLLSKVFISQREFLPQLIIGSAG